MYTLIVALLLLMVLGVVILLLVQELMRGMGKRNEHPQRSRRINVLAIVGIVLFACFVLGMAGRAWLVYQFDYSRGSEAKWGAAWSPDGKRIAFVSRQDGDENIFVMNTDGSNVTQLTSDPFRYYYILRDPTDTDPAWSPDGKQIAFVSGRSGSLLNPQALHIYVMDADGRNMVQLTGRSKNSLPSFGYAHPAWSPDGKKIAFGYGEAIYVMNADGTSPVKIADVFQFYPSEISPSWSPDGKYITFMDITFMEDGTNRSDIYIIRTDGSGRRQLTRNFIISADPAWSPDGKKIMFAGRAKSCTHCNLYIYVIHLTGGYPVKLAEYPSEGIQYKGHITWSPNGDQIALSVYGAIYIMNADGSNLKYLTGIK